MLLLPYQHRAPNTGIPYNPKSPPWNTQMLSPSHASLDGWERAVRTDSTWLVTKAATSRCSTQLRGSVDGGCLSQFPLAGGIGGPVEP